MAVAQLGIASSARSLQLFASSWHSGSGTTLTFAAQGALNWERADPSILSGPGLSDANGVNTELLLHRMCSDVTGHLGRRGWAMTTNGS